MEVYYSDNHFIIIMQDVHNPAWLWTICMKCHNLVTTLQHTNFHMERDTYVSMHIKFKPSLYFSALDTTLNCSTKLFYANIPTMKLKSIQSSFKHYVYSYPLTYLLEHKCFALMVIYKPRYGPCSEINGQYSITFVLQQVLTMAMPIYNKFHVKKVVPLVTCV